MTPERWQQVKGVLHQALELAPDERSAFLDSACSTDHSLRRDVESLLSSSDDVRSSFLNSNVTRVTLSEGTTLGDYKVQSLLGSGGMGEVYRARDLRLGRDVAIKVLPPFFATDRARLQRFEQEARAAAALNHPNILAVHQMGTYEGAPYLVSELLEGETLRARVKRGSLPMSEAVEYALQMARGLAAAHEKGIVHRDLKPENLFVTKEGQIKILDFGLAKQRCPESGPTLTAVQLDTEPGVVLGTVGYMSPEQVRGQTADARSDIFAVGAILYEMLSGKRAFLGESSADTMSAILKEDPPPLTKSVRGIPSALERVVQQCLEKDRELRCQTATELQADLKRLKRDSDSNWSNITPTAGRASPPDKTKSSTGRGVNWIIGSALGIALLGVAVWWRLPKAQPQVTAVVQLSDDGDEKGGALYSDGNRVYFMEEHAGNRVIAEVSTRGGQTAQIATKYPNTYLSDLAPDASALLVRIGPNPGTAPVWIQPFPAGEPQRVGTVEASGAAFFPDGQQIVYTRGETVYVTDKDGTNPLRLADVPGFLMFPRISPEGRRIRISAEGSNSTVSIWQLGTDGTGVHELLKGWHEPPDECCGRWTPDGKYFVFQSTRSGRSDIWALAEQDHFLKRSEAEPIRLTDGPLSYKAPLPSRDGKQIFVTGAKKRSELVRYDEKIKEFVPYLSGISAIQAYFSPNAEWVAYTSYPDHLLWRMRANGTEKVQLTVPPMVSELPRWSPDGKKIAFGAWSRGKLESVFVVAAEGGLPQRIAEGDDPSWSPDGNSLAYETLSGSGATIKSEFHTIDLRTGKDSAIPDSKGKLGPLWSPDGKFLLAITAVAGNMLLFDFKSQKWSELAKGSFVNWEWSRDAKYAYCVDSGGGAPKALRIRVADRHVEVITTLSNIRRVDDSDLGYWAGVAPDGSLLLSRDIGTQEIYALKVKWP